MVPLGVTPNGTCHDTKTPYVKRCSDRRFAGEPSEEDDARRSQPRKGPYVHRQYATPESFRRKQLEKSVCRVELHHRSPTD